MQQRGEAERLQRDRLAARVRAADDERAQLAELEVDRHRACAGRAAGAAPPSRRTSSRDRDGRAAPAPRERRRTRARGRARRSPRRAPPARDARSPTCARELAQDPLDLLALGARRLGEAVVQLDDRERLDEQRLPGADESWTTPGTLPRADALTASTGRPPRSVTNRSCRNSRQLARAGDARRAPRSRAAAVAQLAAQAAQRGRGVVAQVGAVVLDARARSSRPATSSDGSTGAEQLAKQRRERGRLPERAPRLEPDRDGRWRRAEVARRRARRRGRRAPRPRARPRARRATARRRRRAARRPRRSAPAGARPRPRRRDGVSSRASSPPRALSVAPASRSRIAGNSSTARACGSMPASVRRAVSAAQPRY